MMQLDQNSFMFDVILNKVNLKLLLVEYPVLVPVPELPELDPALLPVLRALHIGTTV